MTEHSKEQPITVIGIDLAKRSFHLCATVSGSISPSVL